MMYLIFVTICVNVLLCASDSELLVSHNENFLRKTKSGEFEDVTKDDIIDAVKHVVKLFDHEQNNVSIFRDSALFGTGISASFINSVFYFARHYVTNGERSIASCILNVVNCIYSYNKVYTTRQEIINEYIDNLFSNIELQPPYFSEEDIKTLCNNIVLKIKTAYPKEQVKKNILSHIFPILAPFVSIICSTINLNNPISDDSKIAIEFCEVGNIACSSLNILLNCYGLVRNYKYKDKQIKTFKKDLYDLLNQYKNTEQV